MRHAAAIAATHKTLQTMEIRQIRYFIAVAETLNFTRAAERLHMAQPPLSQQIKQLEDELGADLLRRSKHKVELTDAGEEFLIHSRRIMHLLAEAKQHVAGVARGETGQLRVAFSGSASRMVLPRLLRLYRERRPSVRLIVSDLPQKQQLDALERGDIQVAITRDPVARATIDVHRLICEPMCLVMHRDHPMATPERIDGAALSREPMVMCSQQHSPSVYDMVMRICSGAGFIPNELYQIRAIHSVLDFVAARQGITILPEGMQQFDSGDVIFRPIVKGAVSELCVTRLANSPSLLVQEFVEMAKDEFASDLTRPAVSLQEPRAVEFVRQDG